MNTLNPWSIELEDWKDRGYLVGSCKVKGGGRHGSRERRESRVTRAEGGRLPNKTKDMEEKLSKLL